MAAPTWYIKQAEPHIISFSWMIYCFTVMVWWLYFPSVKIRQCLYWIAVCLVRLCIGLEILRAAVESWSDGTIEVCARATAENFLHFFEAKPVKEPVCIRNEVPSILKYKEHRIPRHKYFSSRLAVVFVQSIESGQVLSLEWRCSWSSSDRRCSNYTWVINNFIATKVTLILETLRSFR